MGDGVVSRPMGIISQLMSKGQGMTTQLHTHQVCCYALLPTSNSSNKPVTSPIKLCRQKLPTYCSRVKTCAQAVNGEPVMTRVSQAGETNRQVKAGEMKIPDMVVMREVQPLNRQAPPPFLVHLLKVAGSSG